MSLVNIVDKTLIIYIYWLWINKCRKLETNIGFWKKKTQATHRFKSELLKLSQYRRYGTIILQSLPGEENMGVNWGVPAFATTASSPKDKEKWALKTWLSLGCLQPRGATPCPMGALCLPLQICQTPLCERPQGLKNSQPRQLTVAIPLASSGGDRNILALLSPQRASSRPAISFTALTISRKEFLPINTSTEKLLHQL